MIMNPNKKKDALPRASTIPAEEQKRNLWSNHFTYLRVNYLFFSFLFHASGTAAALGSKYILLTSVLCSETRLMRMTVQVTNKVLIKPLLNTRCLKSPIHDCLISPSQIRSRFTYEWPTGAELKIKNRGDAPSFFNCIKAILFLS